jgi:hypothetical protein
MEDKIQSFIKKEIAECWKAYKKVGMKKKGNKMVPNCVPKNEVSSWDGSASKNPGMWDGKPSEKNTGKPFPSVGENVYYVDAINEDEAYCPVCTEAMLETVKEALNKINENFGDYTAEDQWDDFNREEKAEVLDLLGYDGNIILHNSIGYEEVLDDVLKGDKETFDAAILGTDPLISEKKGKCKPSKGKRFAKRVSGKCRSYGQKGKAKSGGDRIRPGTKKGNAYCARSAKIKKCKNPPCANALSRKKWKCQGSRSVK